jgi:hypothetical protein
MMLRAMLPPPMKAMVRDSGLGTRDSERSGISGTSGSNSGCPIVTAASQALDPWARHVKGDAGIRGFCVLQHSRQPLIELGAQVEI